MKFRDTYILGRCKEIETLLNQATDWSSNNEELSAHLAAYVSVLITGVLEDCIEHLITQRVEKTGDSEIQNYVCRATEQRFRNPHYSSISGLLKQFSKEYQEEFNQKILPHGKEAEALQSIVDNKNSLAHLGTGTLQLTIKDVRYYFGYIIPILEALEQILS